jgi:hypothetical protein
MSHSFEFLSSSPLIPSQIFCFLLFNYFFLLNNIFSEFIMRHGNDSGVWMTRSGNLNKLFLNPLPGIVMSHFHSTVIHTFTIHTYNNNFFLCWYLCVMFQTCRVKQKSANFATISLIYHHINVYFIMTFIVYKKMKRKKEWKDFNKNYTKNLLFPLTWASMN